MSRQFHDHLRTVESINGEPRISYPDHDNFPHIERSYVDLISKALPVFGTPDADFPTCKLVGKSTSNADRQNHTIHLSYQRVPGYISVIPFTDAETRTPGTIARQLVVKPSFPLPQTPGTETTYTPVNDYCGYLTTQTLTDFAGITRTIDSPENFTFPRLVFGVTEGLITALDGAVRTHMEWDERAEFSALTDSQLVVTYNTKDALDAARPALEYNPILANRVYDGVFFNVNKIRVLNDAFEVGPYTTGTNNPSWGFKVENAYNAPASTPSATEYMALATGAFRVIAAPIEEWKYNLWRMTVRKVKLR